MFCVEIFHYFKEHILPQYPIQLKLSNSTFVNYTMNPEIFIISSRR